MEDIGFLKAIVREIINAALSPSAQLCCRFNRSMG